MGVIACSIVLDGVIALYMCVHDLSPVSPVRQLGFRRKCSHRQSTTQRAFCGERWLLLLQWPVELLTQMLPRLVRLALPSSIQLSLRIPLHVLPPLSSFALPVRTHMLALVKVYAHNSYLGAQRATTIELQWEGRRPPCFKQGPCEHCPAVVLARAAYFRAT